MVKDQNITKVIFRVDERDKGYEVIAVFPELAGDMNPYRTCTCYAHIGQHSAISTDFPQWTRPAKEKEYRDLKMELENGYGYNLRVVKKMTRSDLELRKLQCK